MFLQKNRFIGYIILSILCIFTFNLNAQSQNPNKTVTIYIHGFSNSGAKKAGVFGEDQYESFFNEIPTFLGLPTINNHEDRNKPNVVAATTYYGDTPPSYYTKQDIEEINAVTDFYGGGIPRYALIIAKYTKHLIERTGAQQVNFISGSMGTLVTRWLIEKDLETLASTKKIARWLTVEGVLNGNYAANNGNLVKLVDSLEDMSIDVEHMGYDWIEDHLNKPRNIGQSPYYKDILIGHETSTRDDAKEHALSTLMLLKGQFEPNDGFQAANDTYFKDMNPESRFMGYNPTHSCFHINHLDIKNHESSWAQMGTFLTSNKRVKITLTKAKVNDIKEKNRWYLKLLPAEIVFESKIYSPAASQKWGISDAISEKLYGGAVPPIVKYDRNGQEKDINQIIFNDFVLSEEKELNIELLVQEIDGDMRYGVYESLKNRDYDHVGITNFTVPLKNGIYTFENHKFDGEVKVEIIKYPFPLLGEDAIDDITLENALRHLYLSILGREADEGGLNHWLDILRKNPKQLDQVAKLFLLSEEMNLKNLTIEEFITTAYETLATETPNQSQVESLKALNNHENIIDTILGTDESISFFDALLGKSGGVDEDTILERGDLVYFEKVLSKNGNFMEQAFKSKLKDYPQLQTAMIYGVDAYRIVYTTVTKNGEKINVSGLVTIPTGIEEPISLVSDQHGTIFGHYNSPSVHDPITTAGALISAVRGHAVAMPDYIGYGKTANRYHPYQIKESLATTIIDMIFAAKELLEKKGINLDQNLFLTGYSEGGYATMATLEMIENEYKDKLTVTAAAPMAGSYDLKTTGDIILGQEAYSTPHLPSFLIYSYDRYYEWNSLNDIFNDNYAKSIKTFLEEKEKGNITYIEFPAKSIELFKDDFLQAYFSDEETTLKKALIENSIYDWTPSMPLKLYHCEGDVVVPAINSQIAYDKFIENGAENIELILQPGGSHSSCSIPFYIDVFEWFKEFK